MMRNTTIRSIAFAAGIALLALAAPAPRATAADGSWNVNNAGNWSTAGSWLSNSIPGSTSSTTSTDIATFGFTLTAGHAVTVDANRNIGGIIFSNTSAFGYTLSSGNLLLSNGGVIQSATNNGAHTDTISSVIAIQGVGGSGAFTAGATSASSLLSIGAVTGVSTAGSTTTLTLNGDNTGANAVTGVIGNGSAGGRLAVVKSGNGVWVLSGANTFTGGVTLNSGTLRAGNAAALGTGTLTFGGGSLSSNSTTAYTLTNTMAFTGNATLGDTTNTGALTLSGNADLGGATRTLTVLSTATFGGVVSNGGLTKTGAGTFVLNAANTFTGTTAVNRGTLALDFSAAAAPATNILSTSSPLAVGGGTLQLTGKASTTNSQTVNGLAITPGASQITLTANATANPLLLTLGGISRSTGGTLNLTQPAGTIGATNGFTTTTGNTSGILGGWITAAGADWATSNGTNIVALASYTANTWAAGNNTNVTANGSPAADSITNSLRFNFGAVTTVTLSGTNTITSGGILVGTTVGSRVSTITGGTLRGSSGGDLVVFQNNTSGNLVIASQIADNASATALTKSGAATLVLAGANTYTGTTFVNAGTLQIGNGGTTGSIATSSPVSIAAGGTLAFNRTDNYGGTAFTNAISGAGTITTVAGGTVSLGGDSSGFTGTINLPTGRLNLDFSAASAPTTNMLGASSTLSVNGAGFQLTGKAGTANAQTIAGLTLASSVNTSSIGVAAGADGTAVLNLGSITRTLANTDPRYGGRVIFTLPAGTQNSANGITTTTNNAYGILGGWATVGQTDWATNQTNAAGGNVVALGSAGAVASYTSSATAGNTAANYANANIDVVSSQTLSGATTINTLRFNDAAARTLTLTGTNPIGSAGAIGGILVTPAVGANLSRITGGAIAKGDINGNSDEIIINQFNTQGALQIDSNIVKVGQRLNLTKNGAGTLILTGNANGAGGSGVIFLNEGTIQFGDGTGGTQTLTDFTHVYANGSSTTLRVATSSTVSLASTGLGGSATVDVAANGRLIMSPFTASWIKTGAGSWGLGTAAGYGSGWAKEGTVIVNSGANYAVNGGLTIGDTAQNAPSATVFLQNATRADQFGTAGTIINRTGALDFNNQSIQLGSSPTFVGGGTVTSSNVSSGTATLQGNVTYNAANAFDTGALIEKVTLSLSADRTFTINDSSVVATEMTVSSNISGSFGISKAGAGTMLFSGTNTYSGATTVSGALVLSTTAAVTGTAARPYTVYAAGAVATGFALDQTFLGRVVNTSAGAVALGANSSNNLNFSSGGANFTAASLGAVGTGTWAYTGTLTPNSTVYRLGGGGGTLDFQSLLSGGNTLTVGGDVTGLGGTVILSNTANSFTGKTTVQRGTLRFSSIGNVGGGNSALGAPTTSANGTIDLGSGTASATLMYIGSGHTSDRVINLAGTTGGATIEANGSGALVLTGANTATGAGAKVFTLTGTSTAANAIGAIAGTGVSVNKTGSGLWRLTGASSYTGQLTVSDGTIVVAASVDPFGSVVNGPFGSSGLPIIGSSAAGLTGTAALLVEGGLQINRGMSIASLGAGASQVAVLGITGAGASTFGGGQDITLGRGVTLQASNSGTVTFANNWVNASGPVAFTIGSEGNAGVVVLESELPTATGVSIVRGTARLQTATDNRIGSATPVTIGSSLGSATLDINGQSQTLSNLSFAGNSGSIIGGTLRLNPSQAVAVSGTGHVISSLVALDAAASFNVNAASRLQISSAISEAGGARSLTKTGAGILELAGLNTYTGDTTVSQGTLVVNGSLGAGSLSVAAGATLMGSGTVGGMATIAGIHSPGNSPGIETFSSNLTYSGGASQVVWELWGNTNSNPVAYDQIVVGGNLDFAGLTSLILDFGGTGVGAVNWNDTFWDNTQTWTLFNVTGTTTNFGNFGLVNSPTSWFDSSGLAFSSSSRSENTFSVSQSGNNVVVTYTVIVPEPGSLALAGIGIAAAAYAYRRRRA